MLCVTWFIVCTAAFDESTDAVNMLVAHEQFVTCEYTTRDGNECQLSNSHERYELR